MRGMARRRSDIDTLREQVGTFDAPIGAVQLPSDGVRLDRRGNPKPLQSGQDEHPEPGAGTQRTRRPKRQPEPELAFTTDLFESDPVERAVLAACHKVLAGKQVTTAELRRKLVAAEFDEASIELGIERCTAAGLLDDPRYAGAWVQSRIRRGQGVQRIRQDLTKRGIPKELIDEALAEHADADVLEDAATEAARRKFARIDLDETKARAKATRWLVSRGFSFAQADTAIRTVRQERADAEA